MESLSFLQKNFTFRQKSFLSIDFFVEKSIQHDTFLNSLIKVIQNDPMLIFQADYLHTTKKVFIKPQSKCTIKNKWYFSKYTLKHLNINKDTDIHDLIFSYYREAINLLKRHNYKKDYINNYIIYEIIIILYIKHNKKEYLLDEYKHDIDLFCKNLCLT